MRNRMVIGAAAAVAAAAAGAAIALAATGGGTTTLSSAPAAATAANTVPAAAASSSSPSGAAPSASTDGQSDRPHGPHTVGSCTETLLTGDAKTKAEAAAKKAVPNGTIERTETDCDGAKYEVHMRRGDGSPVTVKEDANFNVTATQNGMGPGGPGRPGRGGAHPGDNTPDGSESTTTG